MVCFHAHQRAVFTGHQKIQESPRESVHFCDAALKPGVIANVSAAQCGRKGPPFELEVLAPNSSSDATISDCYLLQVSLLQTKQFLIKFGSIVTNGVALLDE